MVGRRPLYGMMNWTQYQDANSSVSLKPEGFAAAHAATVILAFGCDVRVARRIRFRVKPAQPDE